MFPLLTCCIFTELFSQSLGQFCTSEGDCRQLKFLPSHTFHGKRLENHVVRTVSVMVADFCETECYMEPNCVSYNLKNKAPENGKYRCELNNSTFEGKKSQLKEDSHYIYRGVKNACLNNPCKNNGTCQTGYSDKGFRCLCIVGFKGPRCKTDIDECAKGTHNCSADATCNNTKGGYNCTCKEDYYGDGNNCEPAVPPSSCKDLYEKHKSFRSQMYTLMFRSQKIPVYCHMGNFECGGGGWTLAMKIDGTKRNFHYDSAFWSNKRAFNLGGGKTGFDHQETKLPSYWSTPFSKICLGMKIGHRTKFIVVNKHANSLFSLIADGKYRSTSLGRNTWKTLLASQASLQSYCNREGFNAKCDESTYAKARIGILANNENKCHTCDSRIGFGTAGVYDDSNTCGNEATYSPDNGNKHIKAMGYILVQ